jgi:acetoacetyl-CoA reductase
MPQTNPRRSLITGGIGAIGTAICQKLHHQGVVPIAGFYPKEQALAETWQQAMREKGYHFNIVPIDVSDYQSCSSALKDIATQHGLISILVNCAGITRDKTLKNMSLDEWHDTINTNLTGIFNATKVALDHLLAQESGRIISISSVVGQMGQFGQTNYAATKAGVHGFTMSLAYEVATKGITVNTVSPGFVDTPMVKHIPQETQEYIIANIPIGRMATPAEIASAVGWLADPDNSYTTGANIPVNGGLYMSS